MRVGWNGGGNHRSLDAIRAEARRPAEDGFASYWPSQIARPYTRTRERLAALRTLLAALARGGRPS